MSSVTMSIFLRVTFRHNFAPFRTTLEFNVFDVYTSVDDIYIYALATMGIIFVQSK